MNPLSRLKQHYHTWQHHRRVARLSWMLQDVTLYYYNEERTAFLDVSGDRLYFEGQPSESTVTTFKEGEQKRTLVRIPYQSR